MVLKAAGLLPVYQVLLYNIAGGASLCPGPADDENALSVDYYMLKRETADCFLPETQFLQVYLTRMFNANGLWSIKFKFI